MTPDALEILILEERDSWRLREAFAPLDEKARAALSSAAQKIQSQLYKNQAGQGASSRLKAVIARRRGDAWKHWNAAETRRANLALFALGPLSAVRKRDLFIFHEDLEVLERIVRDRRPAWLDDWIAHELDKEWTQLAFPVLRAWIRDGICRKPEADGYYRLFAHHLMRPGNVAHGGEAVPPLSRQLLDDPDLLADVDGLFRVETQAFNTNAWLSKGAAEDYESWTEALVRLSREGHLDREYLLGLALDGLKLDLKQNQLSGYHNVYRKLSPTADERLRHQPAFVDLLCHPVGHVVKFAIEMLTELEKQAVLDAEPAMREIPAIFSSDGKGNATAALKLIGRVLDRKAAGRPGAMAALCEAVRHVQSEVQSRALDLLEKHRKHLDQGLRETLGAAQSFVSASNRPRLSALLAGQDEDPAPMPDASARQAEAPGDHFEYRPISEDLNDHPVLAPEDGIEPIPSVDALIAAVAHAAEVVDSPDEIERIVDAIGRLAGDLPLDFGARVAPVLHRLQTGGGGANSLAGAYGGVGVALLDLVLTWLTGKRHRTTSRDSDYYRLEDAFKPMIAHLRTIAERVARGQGRTILSAPTHKGGWIDPLVWIERLHGLEDADQLAGSMDFRLSLLRLAPDGRGAALDRAAALPPETGRIARFALGGDEVPDRSDRANHAAWICAARCRSPLADWSDLFAGLGLDDPWPDGVRPARYDWHSSHTEQKYEGQRFRTAVLSVVTACEGGTERPERANGILSRLARSLTGSSATGWEQLPCAALSRGLEAKPGWSGELSTNWIAQWLAFVWPQNPAGAAMRGATRLVQRIDEDSSSWSPGFGHLQLLFQKGRPWREPGHLLLCLGLVGKDADARGLAVDALIEGIEGRLFDPACFAAVMNGLDEGQWLKLGRLADALLPVVQVSPLHALVVSEALQQWLPGLDLQQKNAFRLLELLLEARALTGRPLGKEAREALGRAGGSGKATKIARQLLAA